MYNFSNSSFPVQVKYIKNKFEKYNPNVSVDMYSLKQGKLTYKNNIKTPNLSRTKRCKKKSVQYIVYPIEVCEEEFEDHRDLLLFGDDTSKQHYCRITNFTKLA